ncbi:hypothetical protein BH20VER2_BH20VER2_14630 [soil metagenome]
MPRDVRFWRNVAIIGICHVAALVGLIRLSVEKKNVPASDVVWMEGGAFAASAVVPLPALEPEPPPEPIATPPPEEQIILPPPEEPPLVTPVVSEIEVATPTPTPTLPPSPTPRPTAKPSPTPFPKPKPTPKATATPKRKPTPKPTPKQTLLAKASPAPTPKPTPQPTPRSEEPAETPTPAAEPKQTPNEQGTSAPARNTVSGTSGSTTGRGSGAANPSQLASYRKRLHDRFYSGWVQPTTTLPAGSKMSALVQVRIEQDGRVSGFNLVRPSGNVVVDASVAAVARRVSRVDPLPASLGNGPYEVKINFELNPEQ